MFASKEAIAALSNVMFNGFVPLIFGLKAFKYNSFFFFSSLRQRELFTSTYFVYVSYLCVSTLGNYANNL